MFWARTTRVCVAHENGMPISTQNDSGHVLTHIFELYFGACDCERNTKFFVIAAAAPGQCRLLNITEQILIGTVQKL